ncbi:Protein of unknown function DUF953 thioredoxin-like [Trinorchestia longiramus]|nr:Protein of unknown function DUF953 thioredoxin-like [Trinorchestia longiramus]
MAETFEVSGIEAYKEKLDSLKGSSKTIIAMFSGGKNPNTGKSWCPDCVVAKPIVDSAVAKASEDFVYIYCSVGDRDFWKDKNCVFRTDPNLRLKSVPTLIKVGTPQRLEEAQCADANLVSMMFED